MTLISDITPFVNDFWQQVIDDIKASLDEKNLNASFQTRQAFDLAVQVGSQSVTIEIIAPDHYLFLDEGVKGTIGGRRNTGAFAFRDKQPPVDAIRQYMRSRGIVNEGFRRARKLRNRIKRRQSIDSSLDQLAFAIARSIFQKGIEQTDFYSEVVNDDLFNDFTNQLADQFEIHVVNILERFDQITLKLIK